MHDNSGVIGEQQSNPVGSSIPSPALYSIWEDFRIGASCVGMHDTYETWGQETPNISNVFVDMS